MTDCKVYVFLCLGVVCTSATQSLSEAEKKVENAEIHMKVRSFMALIEDRFLKFRGYRAPEHILNNVTEQSEYYIINKKSKWFHIIVLEEADGYVEHIVRALQTAFKVRNGIGTISEKWVQEYGEYVLEFCEAIARTCDFVNKQFVRIEKGLEPVDGNVLAIFSNPVDGHTRLFYNAMLRGQSSEKFEKIEEGLLKTVMKNLYKRTFKSRNISHLL